MAARFDNSLLAYIFRVILEIYFIPEFFFDIVCELFIRSRSIPDAKNTPMPQPNNPQLIVGKNNGLNSCLSFRILLQYHLLLQGRNS